MSWAEQRLKPQMGNRGEVERKNVEKIESVLQIQTNKERDDIKDKLQTLLSIEQFESKEVRALDKADFFVIIDDN